MLIGIDASRAVADQRTGTETYSLHLIRAILALEREHEYRLYCGAPPAADLFGELRGAEVVAMPFPRLWTHLRLSWEMAQRPPDVLFVPAHVLPLIHPRRSAVTVHDLGYRYCPEAHGAWSRWYLERSTRYHSRAAAHIIADSEATARDVMRDYRVPAERITVVYPGRGAEVSPVTDPERLNDVRVRYGIPGEYLLYVGTIQPRKNLLLLVDAYATMVERYPGGDVSLVVAGKKGWLSDKLFDHVLSLGLTSRVIMPGYIAPHHLSALLSGARALVFPSLYEGFGFPVLEAMTCGVPVICSDVSSLPEVAGDAALLVDPFSVESICEAIVRVLADEGLRAEMVARGHLQAKRFSWERCARETLEVLEAVGGS